MKCLDIKVGPTILMETDPSVVEQIMTGVVEKTKENLKLSSLMWRILLTTRYAERKSSASWRGNATAMERITHMINARRKGVHWSAIPASERDTWKSLLHRDARKEQHSQSQHCYSSSKPPTTHIDIRANQSADWDGQDRAVNKHSHQLSAQSTNGQTLGKGTVEVDG